MNIALWVAQALIALMFIPAGVMKTFQPQKVKATMPWAKDSSTGFIAFIGLSELLGGLGLILPWATDIAPILTPIAAIGIAVIMLFAAVFHARRGEYGSIGMNFIMLALALFVAIMRF
ncbi:DoxX family protein [Paenibacillus glycanilyticus]|uniref:DoxX family protein n=1 Tax=Paenibacillus glycanilyticus TaxID=126569 RepID=UPI002041CD38|nr:DoxX family protein [Paenibacillus glycanilyticus]MCM3631261.1 DoxX family protein [Paenibacillus glycanilyticus]